MRRGICALLIERENGAAPLLGESGGELLLGDGAGTQEEIAEAVGGGFALEAKSFAELGVVYGGLLD
jgi:hypothetical protein